jgi:hypothetical protein
LIAVQADKVVAFVTILDHNILAQTSVMPINYLSSFTTLTGQTLMSDIALTDLNIVCLCRTLITAQGWLYSPE